MTIFETLKRLQRLPRAHRIAFLESMLKLCPPRSQRYTEFYIALRREKTAQLKAENRAA